MQSNGRWFPNWSLSTATLVAILVAASGLLGGCGEDDPDVEQDAGPVTGVKDGGKPSSAGSDLAMDFVISCTDRIDVGCAEYLGEKADGEAIKKGAAIACAQAGEELKTERCPTAKLVGTCIGQGNVDGAKRWVKSFYYEPTSEAEAKVICMGRKFEPAS